jgi:hypothetical protein
VRLINSSGTNHKGQSALYCAARQGATEVIHELLVKCPNIDVNVQVAEHGGTPLHGVYQKKVTLTRLAASFAQAGEVVALLLSQGADINQKNKQNMTARQEVWLGSPTRCFLGFFTRSFNFFQANGAEVIKVYKLLDKGGIAALAKEYPCVSQAKTLIGGTNRFPSCTFSTLSHSTHIASLCLLPRLQPSSSLHLFPSSLLTLN